MKKVIFICLLLFLSSGCDSDKLHLEAKAGEYAEVVSENTVASGSSTVELMLNSVASETKWAPSISLGYFTEEMGNSLQVMLMLNKPQDKDLVLVYRHLVDGKVKETTSLLKGIKLKESVEIKVSWDKSGVYIINANERVKIALKTKINNPTEYFSVASGSGTIFVHE